MRPCVIYRLPQILYNIDMALIGELGLDMVWMMMVHERDLCRSLVLRHVADTFEV